MSEARLAIELEGGGRRFELPRAGVLTIGAGRADLVVSGANVGEVHCVIGRVKGGGWAVKDLGTPAGTLLDGERVEGAKLEPGGLLTLGDVRLRVVDLDALQAPLVAPPGQAAAAAALGEVSGYRIERALGRGGMGQVFLAEQISLQRKVALKVLAEKFSADADFVRRFQAEARAAAALNHPNIVTVHDVWEERGRHFLSMEFMSGGTLEDRIAREGRLEAKDVVEILSDAAKGLVFAELRGIVHRDIKPANLMVNEVGTTKIADLGLATKLEAEATEEAGGKIFGTPHFIAPEQARGERVDGRADLYALGATAYRLISGHTPFEGASTREILRGHLFETPRPLSEFVPGVPPALSQVVARLLAKQPEERVASAGALLTELERIKLELVHGIPSGGAAARGSKLGLGLAAVFLAVAGGAAWFFFGRTQPASPPHGPRATAVVEPGSETPDPSGGDADVTPVEQPFQKTPPPVVDDDGALARLEREAERAYADLSESLDEEARRLELLRLAGEYAGTTAAGRFGEEAAGIARRLAEEVDQTQQGQAQIQAAVAQLRAALSASDSEAGLGARLAALAGVAFDERTRADAQFQSAARGVWLEPLRAATALGSAALAEADARQEQGQFEGLADELEAARAALGEDDWPQLPEELGLETSEELAALRDVRARLTARVAGLEDLQRRWQLSSERADRSSLAEALHGRRAFEAELRALDLSAARTRLAGLVEQLPLERSRAFVRDLSADLAAGGKALDALITGTWKRRTVNDPRTRGRDHREAVGADARGLLIKNGEQVESLPWSAFGGRPTELHQLFFERLTRDFSLEELHGIAALMRISAVLQAIEEGSEVLEPDNAGLLTPEEVGLMLEGFELARSWAGEAGQLEALEREEAAARVVATGLSAASGEHLGASITALERLLSEHRGTLLVRLLSDGALVPELDPQLPPMPPERLPDPPRPAAGPEEDAAAVEASAIDAPREPADKPVEDGGEGD